MSASYCVKSKGSSVVAATLASARSMLEALCLLTLSLFLDLRRALVVERGRWKDRSEMVWELGWELG